MIVKRKKIYKINDLAQWDHIKNMFPDLKRAKKSSKISGKIDKSSNNSNSAATTNRSKVKIEERTIHRSVRNIPQVQEYYVNVVGLRTMRRSDL